MTTLSNQFPTETLMAFSKQSTRQSGSVRDRAWL